MLASGLGWMGGGVIGYAKPRGAARLPPAKTSIARVPGNEQTSLDDERGSLWRERGVVRVQGHAWGTRLLLCGREECDTVASRPLPREALHALISRWVTSGARSYYSGGKPGSLLASTSNARIPSASASASGCERHWRGIYRAAKFKDVHP